MTSKLKEGVMQGVFTLCACVSILAVALICIFLFANGVPTLFKIGPLKFLLGTTWKPGNDIFGILPMILGSIYVTAGAILVGVPTGLLTAIYMSKFASPRINKVMLPAVQLLAGIPSVVYGFFGMLIIVPAIRSMFPGQTIGDSLRPVEPADIPSAIMLMTVVSDVAVGLAVILLAWIGGLRG